MQPPVIVIPGITACKLDDYYQTEPERAWGQVWPRDFERIALHPDNLRYEAAQPSRLAPAGVFPLVYADLIAELRAELGPGDGAVPVFPFAYDWRKDCRQSALDLAGFVQEVTERCALMPRYARAAKAGRMAVDLVCHSMGGLVAAQYLGQHGPGARVRRVVSLGSPFLGSMDAVLKLVTGQGSLIGDGARGRERQAARSIPSLYQLLPTYPGAVRGQGGAPTDLLDPASWQGSLLRSLAARVKRLGAKRPAAELFARYLEGARELKAGIAGLDLERALPEGQKGWLFIAGIGSPTQVAIQNRPAPGRGWRFKLLPDADEWPGDPESPNTGDGTVPLAGAHPGFAPPGALVCVAGEDFARWELRDQLLSWSVGFHAFLPAMNLVQRLAIRHLDEGFGGEVWGRRPPGVRPQDWAPPPWLEPR